MFEDPLSLALIAIAGVLIAAGALTNVFVLNLTYDVGLKVVSFHLVLLAVVLLLPDLRRLADLFVRQRAVAPPAAYALASTLAAQGKDAQAIETLNTLLSKYANSDAAKQGETAEGWWKLAESAGLAADTSRPLLLIIGFSSSAKASADSHPTSSDVRTNACGCSPATSRAPS